MTFNVFLRVQEVEVSFSGLFRVPCVFKGMFRFVQGLMGCFGVFRYLVLHAAVENCSG